MSTASRSDIGSRSPVIATEIIRLATIVTAGSLRLTNRKVRRVSSNAMVMVATSSGEKTLLPANMGRIGMHQPHSPAAGYHVQS